MESRRPSSATAPSIWYAAVATPQRNPSGKRGMGSSVTAVYHPAIVARLLGPQGGRGPDARGHLGGHQGQQIARGE